MSPVYVRICENVYLVALRAAQTGLLRLAMPMSSVLARPIKSESVLTFEKDRLYDLELEDT